MWLRASLIVICASVLAGCQTTATSCDGWRKLTPRPAFVPDLIRGDAPLAQGIAAHNEHGRRSGCWR